ncbi:MAG TPA: hypothetical protein VLR49_08140 [Ferruginibacter sp.]|nr:hypothetical protein [Ferruginibacter sp.]
MKKLLLMAFALLVSGTMLGQGSKAKSDSKSFLAFHGGPSFPVGDFGSKDINTNENAGLAKNGFTLNLGYGYNIKKNVGIAAGIFYNNYSVDKASMVIMFDGAGEAIDLELDHWQFYGIAAGPMFTMHLNNNIAADLRIMGGISNANSPKISYLGQEIVKGDWGTGATLLTGLDLRVGTAKNMFFFGAVDFTYLDPKFKYTYMDENDHWVTEDMHQKMSVINITAGVGFNF